MTNICDSCNNLVATHEVQKKWKYCRRCYDAYLLEIHINESIKTIMKTHPQDVERPEVYTMLHNGATINDIKRYLDTNKMPEFTAEI